MNLPDGGRVRMASLREFAPVQPLWVQQPDGSLTNQETGSGHHAPTTTPASSRPRPARGMQPGFQVGIGLGNYARIFSDQSFREPFLAHLRLDGRLRRR